MLKRKLTRNDSLRLSTVTSKILVQLQIIKIVALSHLPLFFSTQKF